MTISRNIWHITVTPNHSNKWLLIVNEEFFLSLSCLQTGNLVPTNYHRLLEEVLDELCHSLSVDLSNEWAQRVLINRLPGNASSCHGAKATIKNHYRHSTSFGPVTRIRPVIIITFGTTDGVVHYGITFSVSVVTPILLHQGTGTNLIISEAYYNLQLSIVIPLAILVC